MKLISGYFLIFIFLEFYSKRNIPKLKKVATAERLSRFIPGLGQTWLGYPGEGGLSFLMNATALGLGIYGVISGYTITAYFLGTGFLQKFYFGGHSIAPLQPSALYTIK